MKRSSKVVLIVSIIIIILLVFRERDTIEVSIAEDYLYDTVDTSSKSSMYEIHNAYTLDDLQKHEQFQCSLHYIGITEWEGEEYLFLSLWGDEDVYNMLGVIEEHQNSSFCNGDIVQVVGEYNKEINKEPFNCMIKIDHIKLK